MRCVVGDHGLQGELPLMLISTTRGTAHGRSAYPRSPVAHAKKLAQVLIEPMTRQEIHFLRKLLA
jgi:hypothetical protein